MFDLKIQDRVLRKQLNIAFNKMLDHGQFFFADGPVPSDHTNFKINKTSISQQSHSEPR